MHQAKALTSLSVAERVAASVKRIEALRELNAFITTTFTSAEEAAAQALAKGQARPLEGVCVGVKDNFCTRGVRTTCASRMLENYVPPYTATVVERLQNAGAVVMGKTNMDEFAMGSGSVDSIFGPVRNPWGYPPPEPETEGAWFVAGGSSGGSAVSVASGMCDVALGSDTGGSVRVPAAFCGVLGYKPTYGLLSRHGLIPLVNSMDVPGVFARDAETLVSAINAMAGPDEKDSTTLKEPFKPVQLHDPLDVSKLRIGIPEEFHAPGTSPEVLEAWRWAADEFSRSGCDVIHVSVPHMQHSINCYSVLCYAEVASNMAKYDGLQYGHRAERGEEATEALYAATRHEGFNDVVRGRILTGNYFLLRRGYEEYVERAQRIRRLIWRDMRRALDPARHGCDVMLTPVTPDVTAPYRQFVLQDNRTRNSQMDVYTQPVNMAGVPAVSVPVQVSSKGLPLGLQLICDTGRDEVLLNVASWLHKRAPAFGLTPDLNNIIDHSGDSD